MYNFKSQYLRQPKDLKLNVLCKQQVLTLEGPKGSIACPLYGELLYSKSEKKLWLKSSFNDDRKKAFFKMYQILLTQAALGVLLGYRRQLNVVGIGYQVAVEKKDVSTYLVFKLGFSHQVNIEVPSYISVSCPKPRILLIKGINLQKLNNFAAVLRRLKLPSPYKEKGIYYSGEKLSLKQGKKT